MATKIITKKSSVAAKVPLASDLEIGEIAINLADKKLYSKQADGTVVHVLPDTVPANSVQINTAATVIPTPGSISWNAGDATFDMGLLNGVTNQLGQEIHVYVKAGSAITNGRVVYASGAVGNSGRIVVDNYIANGSIEDIYVLGVATQDIATGNFGYITVFGGIHQINTTGLPFGETWSDGTILYPSPTTAGQLTSTKPTSPNPAIPLAIVVSSHATNGTMFVRSFSYGYHLDDIHDVKLTSPTNGQALVYNSTLGVWENQTVSGGGGASTLDGLTDVTITTPATGQVLKYNGSQWINDTDATGSGGGITTGKAIAMAMIFGG